MATILLIVIYIAFIGLGIPDSLFGAAWPAIYQEFAIPMSYASFVTILISGGTVISSLVSARLINRFGTSKITAVCTSLTALALLGFSLSGNMVWLCVFAIPLGLGAGSIDSALNNYVALHYKATHMSFLHCFYGVGITLSPYLMSLALGEENDWRRGYRIVFFIQLAIALITIFSLPLWKKIKNTAPEEESGPVRTLKFRELAAMPSVRAVWLVFIGSCAIEYTCNTWGSTYLVDIKGMAVDEAAGVITFYYVGMIVGRFLSGVLANRLSSWNLIHIGQGIVMVAVVLLLLPLPVPVAVAALFLVGLGNGPVFPNLVHLTPQNFGSDISQSVMGTQMAAASTGIMLMPPIFGVLVQAVGIGLFPYFLTLMFVLMAGCTLLLVRGLKRQGRY